jgi:hypothetical protein
VVGEVAVVAESAVDRLLPWLLNYLLHSTVLLLSALVVTAWLRHRVRMAEILWRAALITPFLTATMASIRPAGQTALPGALPLPYGGCRLTRARYPRGWDSWSRSGWLAPPLG